MFCNQHPSDAMRFDVQHLGDGYPLSRNFLLNEAKSKDGDHIVYIHPATIVLAQTLRDEFGALEVRSWYRSKSHNLAVGGSVKSKHVLGMAIDLAPLQTELSFIKKRILEMNIGGVGFYDTFIHVDVFSNNRFWNYESSRK
jgi:uncharacterized protein YcbK (DUF882 family)